MTNSHMPHGRYVRPFPAGVGPTQYGRLAEIYRRLHQAADQAARKADQVAQDQNLSPVGRKTAMRDFMAGDGRTNLLAARAAVAEAEAYVRSLRTSMTTSSIDKTDFAAAMVRAQTRDWVRGLDPVRRTAMLASPGLDPAIASAITEAPAALSGVTAEQAARLTQHAMASLNPEQTRQVELIEEAALAVLDASRMAAMTMGDAAGLVDHEVDELLGGPSTAEKIRIALERGSMNIDHTLDDEGGQSEPGVE